MLARRGKRAGRHECRARGGRHRSGGDGNDAGAIARADPPKPFRMIVDRPFMLRQVATGTIVLMSVIDNPRQL
jgi:hypothetical protein